MDSIDQFVADLATEVTDTLFNLYAENVEGLDRSGGAAIRCANLRAYLGPRIGARLALVGEAPSAHGARFSGIAFTAERSLPPLLRTSAHGLRRNGFSEQSATILHRALAAVEIDPAEVILWNVVPFHPAAAGDPLRNRLPTVAEFALGSEWLERFLALMRPAQVAAVGRSAQRVRPGWTRLRHPAHGGRLELQRGLAFLNHRIGDGDILPASTPEL